MKDKTRQKDSTVTVIYDSFITIGVLSIPLKRPPTNCEHLNIYFVRFDKRNETFEAKDKMKLSLICARMFVKGIMYSFIFSHLLHFHFFSRLRWRLIINIRWNLVHKFIDFKLCGLAENKNILISFLLWWIKIIWKKSTTKNHNFQFILKFWSKQIFFLTKISYMRWCNVELEWFSNIFRWHSWPNFFYLNFAHIILILEIFHIFYILLTQFLQIFRKSGQILHRSVKLTNRKHDEQIIL